MPRYCQRCILPETRPGVKLDAEGVCNGCRNVGGKGAIDWAGRAEDLRVLVERTKQKGRPYDCVIPVSGGKDSFWQVVSCLEAGLHPLCVTYAYPARSSVGDANLRKLMDLGVHHLDFHANPRVERRFVEKAFRKVGISGLVSHMGIYSLPIQIALAHDIPLVIYGENTAFEYGSEEDGLGGARIDRRWLEVFGVTAGTTAADWVDEELSAQDLAPYFMPDPDQLQARDIRAIFLGHYLQWTPENSLEVASRHGFRARSEGARVGHRDYVNIDDDMIGVHHHPKWHKFGITRSWDTLSMDIRNGLISREQALESLATAGDETPWDDIRVFCDYLGMEQAEYFRILEGFRNGDIWSRRDGRWVIEGFLLPDFDWPRDPA